MLPATGTSSSSTYRPVFYRKCPGSLCASSEELAFQGYDYPDGTSAQWKWTDLDKVSISKAGNSKELLRVMFVKSDEKPAMLQFMSRQDLETVKQDIKHRMKQARMAQGQDVANFQASMVWDESAVMNSSSMHSPGNKGKRKASVNAGVVPPPPVVPVPTPTLPEPEIVVTSTVSSVPHGRRNSNTRRKSSKKLDGGAVSAAITSSPKKAPSKSITAHLLEGLAEETRASGIQTSSPKPAGRRSPSSGQHDDDIPEMIKVVQEPSSLTASTLKSKSSGRSQTSKPSVPTGQSPRTSLSSPNQPRRSASKQVHPESKELMAPPLAEKSLGSQQELSLKSSIGGSTHHDHKPVTARIVEEDDDDSSHFSDETPLPPTKKRPHSKSVAQRRNVMEEKAMARVQQDENDSDDDSRFSDEIPLPTTRPIERRASKSSPRHSQPTTTSSINTSQDDSHANNSQQPKSKRRSSLSRRHSHSSMANTNSSHATVPKDQLPQPGTTSSKDEGQASTTIEGGNPGRKSIRLRESSKPVGEAPLLNFSDVRSSWMTIRRNSGVLKSTTGDDAACPMPDIEAQPVATSEVPAQQQAQPIPLDSSNTRIERYDDEAPLDLSRSLSLKKWVKRSVGRGSSSTPRQEYIVQQAPTVMPVVVAHSGSPYLEGDAPPSSRMCGMDGQQCLILWAIICCLLICCGIPIIIIVVITSRTVSTVTTVASVFAVDDDYYNY